MEINVVVRDAFAASDLTWYLSEPARTSQVNGAYTVHVQAEGDVEAVLSQIRKWVKLRKVGAVTVHLGDVKNTVASLEPDPRVG